MNETPESKLTKRKQLNKKKNNNMILSSSVPDVMPTEYSNSRYSPKLCIISMFFILGFIGGITGLIFYSDFAIILHIISGLCIFFGFFAILLDFTWGRGIKANVPQAAFSKVKEPNIIPIQISNQLIPGPPTKVTKDLRCYNFINSKELISVWK